MVHLVNVECQLADNTQTKPTDFSMSPPLGCYQILILPSHKGWQAESTLALLEGAADLSQDYVS